MTQTKDRLWTALAIALLGILLMARPALAATSPVSPQPHTSTFEGESEEEIEEGEEGDEEWEETENEDDGGWEQIFDEEEPEEESPKGGNQSPPSTQCPLGSVKPQAFFTRNSGNLRLFLRYRSDSPTSVDVEFWLKGNKSPQLDSAQHQLNENGVLHLGRHLGQGAQSKIDGAPVVIVQVKASAAPPNCKSKVTKRLTAKSGGGQASDLGFNRRA